MIERALKLAREYSDVSAAEMANTLEVSRSYISELESGKKRVTVDILNKYADALRLPASAFLDFSDALGGTTNPDRQRRAEKLVHILSWVTDDQQSRKHKASCDRSNTHTD